MNTIDKNNANLGAIRFRDVGFGELTAGRSVGPAHWPWWDLLFVHRGAVSLRIQGATALTLKRGDGVLIMPDTAFEGSAGQRGARISVQHFELVEGQAYLPHHLAALRGRTPGADRVRFDHEPGLERDIERSIALAFAADTPGRHDLRVAQLALILGHAPRRSPTLATPTSDHREALLLRRLAESDRPEAVTPSDLAEWVALSPSRFRVWFKSRFGVTPKHYLMRRRVREAMRRLRETHEPIKSIAAELRYADVPAFYRDFQRFAGTTPAVYRREFTVRA